MSHYMALHDLTLMLSVLFPLARRPGAAFTILHYMALHHLILILSTLPPRRPGAVSEMLHYVTKP